MTEEHRQMVNIDNELVRTVVHIDDGRDWGQRIIHIMNRNRHIHEGICPPLPPAPKVSVVKITPANKKHNKRGRK